MDWTYLLVNSGAVLRVGDAEGASKRARAGEVLYLARNTMTPVTVICAKKEASSRGEIIDMTRVRKYSIFCTPALTHCNSYLRFVRQSNTATAQQLSHL